MPHRFDQVVLLLEEIGCGLNRKINPFAPGDFAEKRVLKLVEWFSGHCRAVKSYNLPQTGLQVVHLAAF